MESLTLCLLWHCAHFKVPAKSSVSVHLPIRPVQLGMVDITVRATSDRAGDAVRKQLHVEVGGLRQSS